MKKNIQVDSIRQYKKAPSWQIFFELEDDLSRVWQIPMHYLTKASDTLNKIIYKLKLDKIIPTKEKKQTHFAVLMNPDYHRLYLNKKNVACFIVDYWKKYDINLFNKNFKDFSIVYLASLEAITFLKNNGCSLNLQHLAFSIADKHLSLFHQIVEKDIDVIQIGRKNLLLDEMMLQYCKENPTVNYVHRIIEDGKNIYYSTKYGKIGELHTREALLTIMCRAKISIVSSPGLDGGDWKTGGLNPVTVRVLESAIAKCYMLGRFAHNEDYDYFGLKDLIFEVEDNYEHFKQVLENLLQKESFELGNQYEQFLQLHLNSVRAKQIQDDVDGLN
ncbi:MAG: hypothetical protein H6553_02505 [Chitinophagales bacterium]|nr:hypothetical protein [Chitinophagales bacterium]